MLLEITANTTIDGHRQGEQFECEDARAKRLIARSLCREAPETVKAEKPKKVKDVNPDL